MPLTALVVTSPHYLHLVQRAQNHLPIFYYCSDDYTQYQGWGGDAIRKKETELIRSVEHSFFVSQPLAKRAIYEYGAPADRVTVSPNATDASFIVEIPESQICELLRAYPMLKRPLVGVVGGINDRLDFDMIAACAALPEVGSLVMVGPVDSGCTDEALARLRECPKCLFVGQQAHETLPIWMQALDIALIPYRDTSLNRACSPMRLFDHLGAGHPIVATAVCEQVAEFRDFVHIADDTPGVASLVASACKQSSLRRRMPDQITVALAHTWSDRAAVIGEVIAKYTP